MTLRVFEAFAGIGSQRMALENIGVEHEVVAISEIDKFAIQSYNAIHGEVNNIGDISKVEPKDIPDHDLFTYSFPCFTADTLVLTRDRGYVYINELTTNNYVLTHKNRYKKVTKIFDNGKHKIVKLSGSAFDEIKTTRNHKFYVRRKYYEGQNRKRVKKFTKPEWIEVKDIQKGDYVGYPVNTESKIPKYYGKEVDKLSFALKRKIKLTLFWFLIGAYLGSENSSLDNNKSVTLNVFKNTLDYIEDDLNTFFKWEIIEQSENEGLSKHFETIRVHSKVLHYYCKLFVFTEKYTDTGIDRNFLKLPLTYKVIPKSILDLPEKYCQQIIQGYMSASGFKVNKQHEYTLFVMGRKALYGLQHLIAKGYKRYSAIPTNYVDYNPKFEMYKLRFKESTNNSFDKSFHEDGYMWSPITDIQDCGLENVYDIEVEDDHSFTVQNVIVHNCTDISLAGKRQGFSKDSGTRSSLLWECEKVIKHKRPKYLLLENVKAISFKKNIADFNKWLEILESYGYTNYYQVLNAKDYGIPQNRERMFVVSILNDTQGYEFPKPKELTRNLYDMLETDIPEKFYLTDEQIERMSKCNPGFILRRIHLKEQEIVRTLTATCYKRPYIIQLDNIINTESSSYKNPDRGRILSPIGISTCLTTVQGGMTKVKVTEREREREREQSSESKEDD